MNVSNVNRNRSQNESSNEYHRIMGLLFLSPDFIYICSRQLRFVSGIRAYYECKTVHSYSKFYISAVFPRRGLIYSNSIRARDKSNDSRFLSPLPSIFFLSFPPHSSTPPSISRLLIIPPTFYCSFRSDLQINLYGRKNRYQLTCFWLNFSSYYIDPISTIL